MDENDIESAIIKYNGTWRLPVQSFQEQLIVHGAHFRPKLKCQYKFASFMINVLVD